MRDTFEEILIPEAVFEEILLGKERSREDASVILAAIEEGWIKVRRGIEIIRELPSYLGEGEKEAINLMLKERLDWLLMDDNVARRAAIFVGLVPRYSVYLLPFWVADETITRSEALKMLDDLVDTGYYLKSIHYRAVRDLIKSASKS